MSRLKKENAQGTGLAVVAAEFKTTIAAGGTDLLTPRNAGIVVSNESVADLDLAQQQSAYGDIETQVKDVIVSAESIDEHEVNNIGLEASTIVAMGLGDAGVYHEAAVADAADEKGVKLIGDDMGVPAMEAFDETEIGKFGHYSMAFNYQAAQQDEFAETLFPTIVLTPENGGLDIEIEQTMVQREVRRAMTGEVTNFNKQKVMDAKRDHTILASDVTRIHPVVLPDAANAQFFTDKALVPAETLEVDGVSITTAPIKPGVAVDLLGLSAASPLNNGQELSDEDSIDPRANLERMYFKVTDKTDPNALVTSVVAFNLLGLPRTSFYKSPEAKDQRELTINFNNEGLTLTAAMKDHAGQDATALASIGTRKLLIVGEMSGTMNVETGTTRLFGPAPMIAGLYSEDGTKLSTKDGAGKTLLDNLEFELVGYKLEAYHSNANMRHRGLMGSWSGKVERYAVGFKAPVTAKAPVNEAEKRRATDLKTITAIARTRNENDAVTKLVDRAESLKAYASAVKGDMPTPEIEGAGRHYVDPYYQELEIDMAAVINSTKSHERAIDITDTIVNAIRSLAYPMAQDSNYQTALEMITNGRETKPRLVLATDSIIQRHIMVSGDERTASIGMDHKVVISPDDRMEGVIYGTFAREAKKGEADPLSFGAHAWIPEMVSTAQVTVSGSTAKVTTIQPRSRHIGLLPVMFKITIKNLDKALNEKIS